MPLAFDAPVRGVPVGILPSRWEKLEWCGYLMVKKFEDMYYRLHIIPACDGQTNRQRDRHLATACIVRAMHTRRAVKKN